LIVETLAAEDFPILRTVGEGFSPAPHQARAIVAREGKNILGRIFVVSPLHVEAIWVAPNHRSGFVGKKLMDAAENEARNLGVRRLFAFAVNEQIEDYLTRLDYRKQPLTVWSKDVA
jgi:GNAT superfamily N-acetyltransferase